MRKGNAPKAPTRAAPKLKEEDGWATVKAPDRRILGKSSDADLPPVDLSEVWAEGCKVRVSDGIICVRLFQTDIVQLRRSGDVVLSSGGWLTNRTFDGIQSSLKAFGARIKLAVGARSSPGNNEWVVHNNGGGGESLRFSDGMLLRAAVPEQPALSMSVERLLRGTEPKTPSSTAASQNRACRICGAMGHLASNCPAATNPHAVGKGVRHPTLHLNTTQWGGLHL